MRVLVLGGSGFIGSALVARRLAADHEVTAAGIAFFILTAHLGARPGVVAGVAGIVVIADFAFTAAAVVAQPLTGVLMIARPELPSPASV